MIFLKLIRKIKTHFPKNTNLSKREKKAIFKLARQVGCDWDGDDFHIMLDFNIYTNEMRGIIMPYIPVSPASVKICTEKE